MQKKCTECDKKLHISKFQAVRKGKGGEILSYWSKCKPCVNKRTAERRKLNPIPFREKEKRTRKKNWKKMLLKAKKYHQKNYKPGTQFWARQKARHSLYSFLKYNKIMSEENLKWVSYLKSSLSNLKLHIEKQFTSNMNWKNYGSIWHLDHIIPLANFDLYNEKDCSIALHYTNLQPLEAKQNYRKYTKLMNQFLLEQM